MALAAGTRLGPYEIDTPIGAGGMGQVYKARDTRLDRIVAIKILSPDIASDPQFGKRFHREAKIISSLDHPHICTLYDVGHERDVHFLVMQYLDGETLAERCQRGPLHLDEAVKYAIEMCDALAAAHRSGIVHRDLKPGNVMVTRSGIKLLDFGLAKAAPVASGNMSIAATEAPVTARGTILGTLHYMAPEQLEGREGDPRSDIFAFGAVLYELVTGKKAFRGDSQASVITSIMSSHPEPITAVQPLTPALLDHVIRTCLAKDPEARFQSAHDVLVDLRWIAQARGDAPIAATDAGRQRTPTWLAWGSAVVASAAVAAFGSWWVIQRQREPTRVIRASIALPAATPLLTILPPEVLGSSSVASSLAISPAGDRVVYPGSARDRLQLYTRSLDRPEVTALQGAEGGAPFFSPDGEWVAFFGDGKLKKVPVDGGAAVTICEAAFGFGGAWGDDGTIVFAGMLQGPLFRVSADGGKPEPFTRLSEDEGAHRWPSFVPGTRQVLFAAAAGFGWDTARIAVQSLDEAVHRVVLEGGTTPRYAGSGHLIFGRTGSVLGVQFDPVRRVTSGAPVDVLPGVSTISLSGSAMYALSRNGTIVYLPGAAEDFGRSLVWVDRSGREQPLQLPLRGFETPRIAPNGDRIAVTIREGDSDIWVVDPGRGTLTRLTHEDGEDHSAIWTADNNRLAYSSTRGGQSRLRQKPADGSGAEKEFLVTDFHAHLGGWTPDARILFIEAFTPHGSDLHILRREQNSTTVHLQTSFDEQTPSLSPDGRWLAYRSNESGRYEVYVERFPDRGAKVQISTDGGSEPVWARSGRELFYRRGDKLMAVTVVPAMTLSASTPRVVFERPFARVPWGEQNYDVAPDGRRFLMIKREHQPPPAELHLVLNWHEELKQRVPIP